MRVCDVRVRERAEGGQAETFHYHFAHWRYDSLSFPLPHYSKDTQPSLELIQQRLLSSCEQQCAHIILAGQRHVRAHHTAGRGRMHGDLGPLGGRLVVGVRRQTLRAHSA